MSESASENEGVRALKEAAARVGSAILPITLSATAKVSEGSGFLLSVSGYRVLVTAAHVLKGKPGPRFLFGPRGKIRLTDAWEVRSESDGRPDLDIAFQVLSAAEAEALGTGTALPFGRDVPVPPVTPPASITFFGLPVSHTRTRGVGTPLHGSMTILTAPVRSDAFVESERFTPETHFSLVYDSEAVPHEDSTIRRGRALHGMSGGPAFLAEGFRIDADPYAFLHLVGVLVGGDGPDEAPTIREAGRFTRNRRAAVACNPGVARWCFVFVTTSRRLRPVGGGTRRISGACGRCGSAPTVPLGSCGRPFCHLARCTLRTPATAPAAIP